MARSPRSVKDSRQLENARDGRYGVRHVTSSTGVVEGPFAKVQALTAATFGAGTEVDDGQTLNGRVLEAGDTVEGYFPALELGGSSEEVVAFYAESAPDERARQPGQVVRGRYPVVSGVTPQLWTPAQLGSDLALWLDLWDSDFDLRTDNGTDYVERGGDLSGNNNDVTQSSGSSQPEIKDDYLLFDGNDDYFETPITDIGRRDVTFAALVYRGSSNTKDHIFSSYNQNTIVASVTALQENDTRAYIEDSDDDVIIGKTQNLYASEWILFVWTLDYSTSTLRLRINGEEVAQDTNTNYDRATEFPLPFYLGARNLSGTADFFFDGRMSSIVLVDGKREAERIEGHLAHKAEREADISEPLDEMDANDHPYDRNNGPPTI